MLVFGKEHAIWSNISGVIIHRPTDEGKFRDVFAFGAPDSDNDICVLIK